MPRRTRFTLRKGPGKRSPWLGGRFPAAALHSAGDAAPRGLPPGWAWAAVRTPAAPPSLLPPPLPHTSPPFLFCSGTNSCTTGAVPIGAGLKVQAEGESISSSSPSPLPTPARLEPKGYWFRPRLLSPDALSSVAALSGSSRGPLCPKGAPLPLLRRAGVNAASYSPSTAIWLWRRVTAG